MNNKRTTQLAQQLWRSYVHPSSSISPKYQCLLHTSNHCRAIPLSHATTPAPPPEAPTSASSSTEDRVERKRRQAELLKNSHATVAKSTTSTTGLQKRFWKNVHVKEALDELHIFLDSRPVRTPSKKILAIPSNKRNLATAIALEWDALVSAQQALKQHYIPLTSLSSRALDIKVADEEGKKNIRDGIVAMVMRYLSTDTLLCWAPENNLHDGVQIKGNLSGHETLRALQISTAQPIIAYLSEHIWPGVELKPAFESGSILPDPQPEMTIQVVQAWVSQLPPFELAGLERAVLATKSLLIAVRLLVEWSQVFARIRKGNNMNKRFGILDAAAASTVEVRWQTGMWGEVEDTHDVEKEDLLRQLGGVVLLVGGEMHE